MSQDNHTRNKYLFDMVSQVHDVNVNNGWFDKDRSMGDDIALLHSEISEMFEAYRKWDVADLTPIRPEDHGRWCKAQGWTGPCPSDGCPIPKPEGFGPECADVLIRLLDTCYRYNIDLEAEFTRVLAYLWTREYQHGGKKV